MIRGLVLAGGRSSRFGEDKAIAKYLGVTFLERAVNLLKSLNLKPIVVTRPGAEHSFAKCTLIYDKLPGQGPLGGIYTAMTVFKNTSFLVLTCDMPALNEAVLRELLNRHETSPKLTFYSMADGSEQPFPAIYDPPLLDILREKLKHGDLSMKSLFKEVPSRKSISWQGDPAVFWNINSKEDLEASPELIFK